MTSEEINERLRTVANKEEIAPSELNGSGKAIAYYGWFWRTVDFDRLISFAYANGDGKDDVPGWVGFCQNNKWGYEEFTTTPEQSAWVRNLCEAFAKEPTASKAKMLFDYMQMTRPVHVTGKCRWNEED